MEPDSAPLIATAELMLPDECTMATVMLSHTNPLSWGSSDIIVRVSPEGVETDFAVASATGWGWTGSGYWERADWLPRGTVTAGRGQLPLTNGIAAERLTVYGDIGYTFLIAQLTDCQNAGALVVGPVRIGSDGVATSYLATPYEPPHLDPCRPFYVRFGETVRIWQATQVEPTEGGLALPGLTESIQPTS